MSDHKPGRLGTCPICGEKFTNTDKDVKLYQLQLMRWPLPRNMKAQTIWYRIHEHCVTEFPDDATIGKQLACLYRDLNGLNLLDNTRCGDYE